jgi:hypothetical protein
MESLFQIKKKLNSLSQTMRIQKRKGVHRSRATDPGATDPHA